jgi:hypothetical protein
VNQNKMIVGLVTAFVALVGTLITVVSVLLAWRNSPGQRVKRALAAKFLPQLASISSHFEALSPVGFMERVVPFLDEMRKSSEMLVIDGLSGIGKTFALKTALSGETGVIYMSFRDKDKGEAAAHAVAANAFGMIEFDGTVIKQALLDYKSDGRHAIIVVDDVHRGLKLPGGDDLVSALIVWCADAGLCSVVFVGSELVLPAVNAAKVPGRSRVTSAKFIYLQPIPAEAIASGMKSALTEKWGRPAAEHEVRDLSCLVGVRMKDVGAVVQSSSFDAAMGEAGRIVRVEAAKLGNLLEANESEEALPIVKGRMAPLLLAMLQNDSGVLRGDEIKREWDTVIPGLEAANIVRFEQGTASFPSTLQFHHTAVQAAARDEASRGALSKHEGSSAVLTSEFAKAQAAAAKAAMGEIAKAPAAAANSATATAANAATATASAAEAPAAAANSATATAANAATATACAAEAPESS